MSQRIGGQDPNIIQQKAFQNWQTRINTPLGNPNAPQTFMNNAGIRYGSNNQYQMYYQQCMACGQSPMSQMQYLHMMQQGTDPLVTLQSGVQSGKSIAEMVTDIVGLFKGNKASKASPAQTEAQQTLINNYQAALQNNSECKIENMNDFVNAQFAGMNASGNSVTTEQYTKYLQGLGFDNDEAAVISKVIDMSNNDKKSDNTISKKELTNFYNTVIGKDKTLSATKLEQAMNEILEKTADKTDTYTQAMEAKGYSAEPREINGEVVLAFIKGDEVIPYTETDKINQIINGE